MNYKENKNQNTKVHISKHNEFNKSLSKTDFPLNIPASLLVALAAEEHTAERQWRHLRSTFNKMTSRRFRFRTCRPKASKWVKQNFEPL